MDLSKLSLIHLFCIWCAVSLLVCVIVYCFVEMIMRLCCSVSNAVQDSSRDEDPIEAFDDVVNVVQAVHRDSESMVNYEIELEVQEETTDHLEQSDTDLESGSRSSRSSFRTWSSWSRSGYEESESEAGQSEMLRSPYLIRRIIVKPLTGDHNIKAQSA